MAAGFANVDRDTPNVLPPPLREWVPEDDRVHFVIQAVARMNLSTLRIKPPKGAPDDQEQINLTVSDGRKTR